MADIDTNDVLRMTANLQTVDLSAVQNVYTIRVTVPGAGSTSTQLSRIAIILELIYEEVRGLQNSRTKYIDIDFFNITQDIPLPSQSWPTISQGSLALDDLAHMTSAMFSLGVGKPGVNGRKFFGGISEPALDQDGLWTTSTVIDLLVAATQMLVTQTEGATTIEFGIITGIVPAFIQFISSLVTNVPGTQRRRRQGVGI